MGHERAAFLDAMRRDPEDAATPLVFADWLDEHGDAERAAFVRLQCRGEATRDAVQGRKTALCRRMGIPERFDWAVEVGFSRGFLDSLSIPVQWLLDGAEVLTSEEPLLRKLTVGRVNGWGPRLAALPLLGRLAELEVEAWLAPLDAVAISASSHLSRLQKLEVWLGNDEGGDAAVLEAFARGVGHN